MQERNEKQEKEKRKQKRELKKDIQIVRMTGHSGEKEKKNKALCTQIDDA